MLKLNEKSHDLRDEPLDEVSIPAQIASFTTGTIELTLISIH